MCVDFTASEEIRLGVEEIVWQEHFLNDLRNLS